MSEDKARPRGRPAKADDGGDPDDLDRLLSSAGADDAIQFYRHDAAAGKWVYLEQLSPADIAALGVREFVADRYGGGTYRGRIRNRATGTFAMARSFSIAGAQKVFARGAAAADPAASSSSSSSSSGAGESIALKVGLAIGVPIATAFGTYFAKKLLDGPARDPALMELIGTLKAGRRGDNNGDPLELAKLLQGAEDRGERRGIVIGELKAAAESGGAGAGDGWGEVLSNSLGTLEQVANRYLELEEKRLVRVTRPGAAAPLTLVAETPAPVASSSSSSSSSAAAPAGIDVNDPLVQMLGSIPLLARKFMLSAAMEGDDPAVYVPLVLTKLEDAHYQVLVANIDREDLLELAFRVVPKWREYGEWFAALFAGIRETIKAATPAADVADVASDSAEPAA